MIGLIFFGAIGLWIFIAVVLGLKLPKWFKLKPAWSWLFVPLVFFAPVMDEFIGRWQFNQLCEKEAVIWLSPDWKNVQAAKAIRPPFVNARWTFIPIEIQRSEYVDADTGQLLMSNTGVHTKGGMLLGTFGLGLGRTTSCWPKNDNEIYKMIDIDTLIQKGKSK